MFEVVSTEYQEHVSATTMRGTSMTEVAMPTVLRAAREISFSSKAHWATKHSSATVATDRPTATPDSQWSNRQIRGTS